MKDTSRTINYLKMQGLWDAYVRNCKAIGTDPIGIIDRNPAGFLNSAFIWADTPEGRGFWSEADRTYSNWSHFSTTPLKVVQKEDGTIILTGDERDGSRLMQPFKTAEEAREWLAENFTYEVDFDTLMGLSSSF